MDNENVTAETAVVSETTPTESEVSTDIKEIDTDESEDSNENTGNTSGVSSNFEAYLDGSFDAMYAEEIYVGDYCRVLSEIHCFNRLGYQEIKKQTELLTEIRDSYAADTQKLEEIYTVSVYILVLLILYGVGKLLSGTLFHS